jgi:hypothetical protein
MIYSVKLSENELLTLLDNVKKSIQEQDSMQGIISYEWADEPGFYMVNAVYRIGNSEGQGGMRIIGKEQI